MTEQDKKKLKFWREKSTRLEKENSVLWDENQKLKELYECTCKHAERVGHYCGIEDIGKLEKESQKLREEIRKGVIMKQKKPLMIVVYTGEGHTYTFYDVENIKYHNKNLEFDYKGFSGITHAQFNHIVGLTKHKGVKNPHVKHDEDKEHYNNPDIKTTK